MVIKGGNPSRHLVIWSITSQDDSPYRRIQCAGELPIGVEARENHETKLGGDGQLAADCTSSELEEQKLSHSSLQLAVMVARSPGPKEGRPCFCTINVSWMFKGVTTPAKESVVASKWSSV